jgi:hypothetical protein
MLKLLLAFAGFATITAKSRGKHEPAPSYKPIEVIDEKFSRDLSCYNCINEDYIYCLKTTKKDNTLMHVKAGEVPPQGACCKSYFDCPELLDEQEWTCSS